MRKKFFTKSRADTRIRHKIFDFLLLPMRLILPKQKIGNRGFTFPEIMIIMVIIAILAIGTWVIYTSLNQKARDSQRVADMSTLQSAIEQQYHEEQMYKSPATVATELLSKGYINRIPIDPVQYQKQQQLAWTSFLFPSTFAKKGDDDDDNDDDETGVTICHVPPGNPENAHTIIVTPNSVNGHLNHGDSLGACPDDPQGAQEEDPTPPPPTPPPVEEEEECTGMCGELNYTYGVADDPVSHVHGQHFELSISFENRGNRNAAREDGGNDPDRQEAGSGVAIVNTEFTDVNGKPSGTNPYQGTIMEATILGD